MPIEDNTKDTGPFTEALCALHQIVNVVRKHTANGNPGPAANECMKIAKTALEQIHGTRMHVDRSKLVS